MSADMATDKSDDPASGRYIRVFAVLAASVLGLVLLTNWLVDPYLSHEWDSDLLQRLRPTREKLSPWAKTYAVAKYRPQVVYLGNSRTEAALPPDPSLFGGKRVFNAAVSGATVGDAIAMSRHARTVARPEIVVWGVDYPTFSMEVGNTDFDRELVATGPGYSVRRFFMDLRRAVSFDMTLDSIDLLLGRAERVCRSSLAFHGQRDEACVVANLANRGGAGKALITDIQSTSGKVAKTGAALEAFQTELSSLCKLDTRTLVYINPLHAITAENFYERGHGGELEQWKRGLVRATEQARGAGCKVELYDFSGFNSITSEPIPQVSGQPSMRNYWEGSHYRTPVGRQILARMIPIPGAAVPADFGVLLTADNIETHLAGTRDARQLYRLEHPRELLLLKQWFGPKTAVEPSS